MSVAPAGIPGEILKVDEEARIPYVARLLHVEMNNNVIPADW